MSPSAKLRCQVTTGQQGVTLAAVLREADPALSWSQARRLCASGKVTLDGRGVTDPAYRVSEGQWLEVNLQAPRLRGGELPGEAVVYADRDVAVVHKPAGLLSVPYAGEKDTLIDRLRVALRRRESRAGRYEPELGIVHRLDKDTSGLLVFPRTLAAKKHLAAQFRARTVRRHYLAIAHGVVEEQTMDTHLVTNRGDGLRGTWGHFRGQRGGPPEAARRAITYVLPECALRGATLVRCSLRTGRQHQIRIHLSEAGHMLLGERVYLREHQGSALEAPRLMLHARELGFEHPRTGELLTWQAEPPSDFAAVLERLTPA